NGGDSRSRGISLRSLNRREAGCTSSEELNGRFRLRRRGHAVDPPAFDALVVEDLLDLQHELGRLWTLPRRILDPIVDGRGLANVVGGLKLREKTLNAGVRSQR